MSRMVSYDDLAEIWRVVAEKRRAKGDEAGAERASSNAEMMRPLLRIDTYRR